MEHAYVDPLAQHGKAMLLKQAAWPRGIWCSRVAKLILEPESLLYQSLIEARVGLSE